MLKYKLKDNPIPTYSFSYLQDYLKELGIEKVSSFLGKPDIEDEESYNRLKNIDKIVEALHEGFSTNKRFFLQVDSDADG